MHYSRIKYTRFSSAAMSIEGSRGKPDVIPGEKFALPVTWVRGIKLRLFAFSSVAASHDSFATGLRSGRPIFVLPLLRENKTPGCPIQRVLENDFVVVTGTGTARDFIRLLTVELVIRQNSGRPA